MPENSPPASKDTKPPDNPDTPSVVSPSATRCGVNVLTWGTDAARGNGMGHFLDAKFFGKNFGHAAIQLVFPANAEGDRLVKEYCSRDDSYYGLPFVKRRYVTPFSAQTGDQPDAASQEAYTEAVYEVYWSWWPAGHHGKFRLQYDIENDRIQERDAVDFTWDPRWAAVIEPERRQHKGLLGTSSMSYAPLFVLHQRNLSDPSVEASHRLAFEYYVKRRQWDRKQQSLAVLKKKLQTHPEDGSHNTYKKLTKTEKNLLDSFIVGWEALLPESGKISTKDTEKLLLSLESIEQKEKTYHDTVVHLLHQEDKQFIEPPLERLKNVSKHPVLRNDAIDDLLTHLKLHKYFIGFSKTDETLLAQCDDIESNQALSADQCAALVGLIERYSKALTRESCDKALCKAFEATSMIMERYDEENSTAHHTETIELKRNTLEDMAPFLEPELWQDLIPFTENEENIRISPAHLKKLIDRAMPAYSDLKDDFRGYGAKIELEFLGTFEDLKRDYLSAGTAPDHTVHLPMAPLGESSIGSENGLNIENMLRKMRALSAHDADSFDLYEKNCSKTSDAILEAGATQDYQKDFFRKKALGVFGTPQETLNHAIDFQKTLEQGPKGFLGKLLAFSPLQNIMNACLREMMDPSQARPIQVGATLMLLVLSPLIALRFAAQRLLNPLGTFRMATRGLNFARHRDFKGIYKALQGSMILITAAVATVFSPLALVQWTASKAASNIYKGIRSLTASAKKSDARSSGFSEQASHTLSMHQHSLNEEAFLKQIDQLKIYVHSKYPVRILKELSAILENEPHAIPVLTEKAENVLLHFLKKHPHHALEQEYQALCTQTQARVMSLQKKLLQGETLSIGKLEKGKLVLHGYHQHAKHEVNQHTPAASFEFDLQADQRPEILDHTPQTAAPKTPPRPTRPPPAPPPRPS